MRRRYSIEETFELDQTLKKLAIYEVAEGRMVIPATEAECVSFELECAKKFNYFKDLIQRGECTIEYLKDTVLFKNGAFNQADEYIDSPEELMEVLEIKQEREEQEKQLMDTLYGQLDSLLTQETIVIGEAPEDVTTIESEPEPEVEKKDEQPRKKNSKRKRKNTKSTKPPEGNGKSDK